MHRNKVEVSGQLDAPASFNPEQEPPGDCAHLKSQSGLVKEIAAAPWGVTGPAARSDFTDWTVSAHTSSMQLCRYVPNLRKDWLITETSPKSSHNALSSIDVDCTVR
jgi:hypothetical protein